jgi:hypothetical protein
MLFICGLRCCGAASTELEHDRLDKRGDKEYVIGGIIETWKCRIRSRRI